MIHFEYAYVVIVALLILVGAFYISPYELKVNEDEDDE
jgi:hypothetical protein